MKQVREIKFRAWDGKYKKMRYKVCVGNLHDEENYTAHSVYLKPGDTDYKIEHPGQWMNFDEHSDYTLMQYTGQTDRNGKEIYEGDIIKTTTGLIYEVFWCEEMFSFRVSNKTSPANGYMLSSAELDEVIGNIYEHAELFK